MTDLFIIDTPKDNRRPKAWRAKKGDVTLGIYLDHEEAYARIEMEMPSPKELLSIDPIF